MDMRITVLCFVTTFLLQVVSIYSSFPTSRGMPMVAEHFFQSDGSMERAHPIVPKCTMEQGEIMEASRGRKVKKHRNKMKARGGIDVQRTVKLNRSQKFGEPQIPEQHMGTAFRSGPGKSSKAQFMSPAVFNDSDKIGDPSVLYYCVLKISPDPEDVKLIENQSAGETALLHQIAFEGCEQMTEHVLWLSPDNIDDPDEDGMAPIHLAALGGSRGVMALLHGHGADLQALDNVGNTALHHSVFSKDPKSLIWLLMIGLDVNTQNFKKETPLHLAVGHSEFSMVKHLLDNGALINITNHKGKTPVDLANDSENLQISKLVSARKVI